MPRLSLVPSHQRPPKYFSQPELKSFLAAITSPRDLALFSLIYHLGLRVGEVSILKRCDVDLERLRILVRRLKSGTWSEQPLFRASAKLLARHMATIPVDPEQPLFPGRVGALRKRQIQSLFARYRDRAGLPRRFTCHSLRHSIATHLLDAGVALEVVQDRLGHQSIRSTSIYARITDHHRTAVFRELERSPWIVQPAPDVSLLPPPEVSQS